MTKALSGILATSVAALATVAFAPAAFAAAAITPTTVTTGLTPEEILAKANAARVGSTAQMVTANLFNQGGFRVNVEQRIPGTTPPSIHVNNAEMFYVIDGEATIISGGELDDANGQPVPIAGRGGTIQGVTIKGGQSRVAKKGDLIFVPAGQPHQIANVTTSFTEMAVMLNGAIPVDPAVAAAGGGGRGGGGAPGAGGGGAPGGAPGGGAPGAGGGRGGGGGGRGAPSGGGGQ